MKPYFQNKAVTLYHGDCSRVLREISWEKPGSCFITDPPWGVDGGTGGNKTRGKAAYLKTGWRDTEEYVSSLCVPVVRDLIKRCERGAVTPGGRCAWKYPQPCDLGCFWYPASVGISSWGFCTFHPILYYGKDPRRGKCVWPSGTAIRESRPPKLPHPCPKPTAAIRWLLQKVAAESGVLILDPFAGSGTTLLAAYESGRKAIGIEIEERYCELIANRLSQTMFEYKTESRNGGNDGNDGVWAENSPNLRHVPQPD